MTFNGLYIRHFVYPIFGFGGACFAFIAARVPEAAAVPEISRGNDRNKKKAEPISSARHQKPFAVENSYQ